MKKILKMFWTFFKIGAFTFGGGFAMIPLIETEVVTKNKWLKKEEFIDIIVVSQTLPGALAVNMSTFIGYKIRGILGAIASLLGVILPSFFIITVIAAFLMQFRSNYYVDMVFSGINAAVPMLILIAIVSISKSIKKNYMNLIIIILSALSILLFNVNPIFIVISSGLFGIVFLRKQVE